MPATDDVLSSIHRMARGRGIETVARILGEFADSNEMRALPAFGPERLPATAEWLMELILLPMMMRALFGEDRAALLAEVEPHVAQSVGFFLAACRHWGED